MSVYYTPSHVDMPRLNRPGSIIVGPPLSSTLRARALRLPLLFFSLFLFVSSRCSFLRCLIFPLLFFRRNLGIVCEGGLSASISMRRVHCSGADIALIRHAQGGAVYRPVPLVLTATVLSVY